MSELFAEPTKQSPVAIILLIYKYFINIIRQFWPAIIAVFIGRRSGNISNILLISVIVVAIAALIFAIASYLRFSFKVHGNELLIEKGVFKKSKLNIPFERIQTLNFEQGIIHQIFNVVRIEVDTAGSSKNEFSFNAIDKSLAESLRTLVLERKSDIAEEDGLEVDGEVDKEEHVRESIFQLALKDLFIVGLTQNHLRTLVLLFFFTLWGVGELSDAGLDLDWLNKESATALMSSGILIVSGLALFLLIVIILGTAVRTVLKYYDFKMFRSAKGFNMQSGLLNRKENAALDHKIQQIKWSNNPLKRIFKIHHLQLRQASSIEVSTKKSINVPGIQKAKIKSILDFLVGAERDYEDLDEHRISKLYFYRNMIYLGILPWVVIFSIVFFFTERVEAYLILLAIPYFIATTYVQYRKWKFRLSEEIVFTHRGIFENKHNLVQLYKIQNIQIHQSPFQWRRGLANIRMFTAAGSILIPYIPYDQALKIKDLMLKQIETNQIKWY
jgi:putative membrane protein